MPLWNEHRNIIVRIFLRVFLSLTIAGLKQKERRMTMQGRSNQSSCNIESHPSKPDFIAKFKLGIDFSKNISCHVAKLFWLSLPLRHAQFAKKQSCSFISVWVNLYSAFMLPLSAIICFGLEVLDILPKVFFKLSEVLRLKCLP